MHAKRFRQIAILILLLAASAHAVRLHGHVLADATGEPLIGANLNVLESSAGASTNLDGYYVIAGLDPGLYTIRVSYQGYVPINYNLHVNTGDDVYKNFRLQQASIQLEEVTVTAEQEAQDHQKIRVHAGEFQLNAQRIQMAPALIQTDVIRAFLYVPGVLPSNDFSSDLNVRGSAGDENLIMLDGVEVYNPNHMGGLFSTFIPSAVKHAELLRSSYPAKYGGRLGAVLCVNTKEGNREELSADINLGVLSSSLLLEAPLFDRGSFLLAGRRTYVDLATRLLLDTELPYHFTDFQGRGNFDVNQRDRISVSGYYGDDVFDLSAMQFTYGNRAYTGNWRHIINSALYSKLILSWSNYSSHFDFGGEDGILEENFLTDLTARGLLEYHYSDQMMLETGLLVKNIKTQYDFTYSGFHAWHVPQTMSEISVYGAGTWKPNVRTIIEPGLRLAIYRTERLPLEAKSYIRLEPRLGGKYFLNEKTRLKLAWGLYNQGIVKAKRDRTFYSAVWTVLDSTAAPATSTHTTAGIEYDISQGTYIELEGYYKTFNNVREMQILGEPSAEEVLLMDELFYFGKGRAFGMDLGLQRTRGRWTGQISYSLSWAYRQFDEIHSGEPFYTGWDTRHNLNLLSSFKTWYDKKKWFPFVKFGIFRFNETDLQLTSRYATGARYTEPSQTFFVETGSGNNEEIFQTWGFYNAARLSDYFRIDLTLAFTHRKENSQFMFKIGMLNVLNAPNYWNISFDTATNPPEETKTEGIGRIPSLEMNWSF